MSDPRTLLDADKRERLGTYHIGTPFAPLYKTADARSQLTEGVFGQRFDIHGRVGDYAYGALRSLLTPGRIDYVGWMLIERRSLLTPEPSHAVSVLSAPVFTEPDLKIRIGFSLPLGARLSLDEADGHYRRIVGLDEGSPAPWIHERHIRALDDVASDPVTVARRYLGQPYVWGGNGARGVDCSGLVQMALVACGVDAPRDADQQEAALGAAIDVDAVAAGKARPCDLLFWPGHVGILSAPTMLLHANAHHMAVVEEPLMPALERMAEAGIMLSSARRL